jgi:hypothetical protein
VSYIIIVKREHHYTNNTFPFMYGWHIITCLSKYMWRILIGLETMSYQTVHKSSYVYCFIIIGNNITEQLACFESPPFSKHTHEHWSRITKTNHIWACTTNKCTVIIMIALFLFLFSYYTVPPGVPKVYDRQRKEIHNIVGPYNEGADVELICETSDGEQ